MGDPLAFGFDFSVISQTITPYNWIRIIYFKKCVK